MYITSNCNAFTCCLLLFNRTKWDSNSQGFIIQTFSKCVTSPMAVSPWLCNGRQESRTPVQGLEVLCFTTKLHALVIDGSRKIRTSNRIVKSYLLYHWAMNPKWERLLLSELDSNKHRTLPKNGDLPISRSLISSITSILIWLPCIAWYIGGCPIKESNQNLLFTR